MPVSDGNVLFVICYCLIESLEGHMFILTVPSLYRTQDSQAPAEQDSACCSYAVLIPSSQSPLVLPLPLAEPE